MRRSTKQRAGRRKRHMHSNSSQHTTITAAKHVRRKKEKIKRSSRLEEKLVCLILFRICQCLRLARYNRLLLDSPDTKAVAKTLFLDVLNYRVCALTQPLSFSSLTLSLCFSWFISQFTKRTQQPTISTREKRQQSTAMHTCTHSISVVIYYRWCIECEWSSLLKWARFDKYTYLYVRISKPKHSFNGERMTMCMY